MKDVIPLEQIPNEVIKEISDVYEIDYSIYGTNRVPPEARSKRLMFTQVIQENVTSTMMGPESFTEKEVTGDIIEGFIARGIWDDEKSSVQLWEVKQIGPVIKPYEVVADE